MKLILRTDGGARGNPGPAAAGVVIEDAGGKRLFAGGFFLGQTTNNVAEYQAIRYGLEQVLKLGGRDLVLYSDSELIVKQLRGEYRVKNANLRQQYEQVAALLDQLDSCEINHVYRTGNSQADALVNRSLDVCSHVGDAAVGSKTREASDAVVTAELPGLVPLRDRIRFSTTAPQIDTFFQNSHLVWKLICVATGQSVTVKNRPQDAFLLLLQGSGTWTLAGEHMPAARDHWFCLPAGQSLQVSADREDPIVLLISEVT